ncbi:hypothetical protein BJ508DRAFT_335835 [Ascobolus immersus RN42]|uniref:Uncharacterized protein n=1 Tax=Ascobolus immersus RN42 TaxID=1160509 RepID=A0A3N4HPP8_ASCIM|nr:hypothetical protein BJ508DRAFT_335835 [Ascobolus immersus RN42]
MGGEILINNVTFSKDSPLWSERDEREAHRLLPPSPPIATQGLITPRPASKVTFPPPLDDARMLAIHFWTNMSKDVYFMDRTILEMANFIEEGLALTIRWDLPMYYYNIDFPQVIIPITIGYFVVDIENYFGAFISADPEKVLRILEAHRRIKPSECEGAWDFSGDPYTLDMPSRRCEEDWWGMKGAYVTWSSVGGEPLQTPLERQEALMMQ